MIISYVFQQNFNWWCFIYFSISSSFSFPVDIDECSFGICGDVISSNCDNSEGNYSCHCIQGYYFPQYPYGVGCTGKITGRKRDSSQISAKVFAHMRKVGGRTIKYQFGKKRNIFIWLLIVMYSYYYNPVQICSLPRSWGVVKKTVMR